VILCYSDSMPAGRKGALERPPGRSSKISPKRLCEQYAMSRSAIAKLPIRVNCLASCSVFSCSRSFEGSPGGIGFSGYGDMLSKAEDQEDRTLLSQPEIQAAV